MTLQELVGYDPSAGKDSSHSSHNWGLAKELRCIWRCRCRRCMCDDVATIISASTFIHGGETRGFDGHAHWNLEMDWNLAPWLDFFSPAMSGC